MDKKKSTGLLLSILGVLSLVLITAGVTYAFFTYTRLGDTTNTISTGTIEFLYDEKLGEGNGIHIQDALPMTDVAGKTAGDQFRFTVTSTTPSTADITYDVTARRLKSDNPLGNNEVRLYLVPDTDDTAELDTNNENKATNYAANPVFYGALTPYNAIDYPAAVAKNITLGTGEEERLLYTYTIPAGKTKTQSGSEPNIVTNPGYTNTFTLRMWIYGGTGEGAAATEGELDYSPKEYKYTGTENATVNGNTVKPNDYITSSDYYSITDSELKAKFTLMYSATGTDTDAVPYATYKAAAQKPAYDEDDPTNTNNRTPEEQTIAGYKQVQIYENNGKEFKIKVNVYANAAVATNNN